MTGNTYQAMIDNFVVSNIRGIFEGRSNGRLGGGWWVQDGAPAHQARAVTARLNELFGNRMVSLEQKHKWLPRFPDLTPLNFFLWCYIKGHVFKTSPANNDELRERFANGFVAFRRARRARRAIRDMRTGAIRCVEGGEVEGRNWCHDI